MKMGRIEAKTEETTLPFGIEGLRWIQAPPEGLLEALLGTLRDEDSLPCLKDSPLRKIFRWVGADGESVVLKTYERKGWFEALRSGWIRSRSLLERERLREAAARGLPVPRVLGAAIEGGAFPRRGLLLLEDLGEGEDLLALLRAGEATPALFAEAGQLLRQAFEAGLRPRDLHLGNLFRTRSGALHLLDLHAERLGPAPWRPRARALTALYLSLPWPEQEPLRAALFAPLGLPATPAFLLFARRRWVQKRALRALRSSGSYRRTAFGIRRHPLPTLESPLSRPLPDPLPTLDELQRTGTPIKRGRRGQVLRTPHGILKTRTPPKARRLWLAQETLALLDLPHPQGLLLYDRPPTAALLSRPLPAMGDTHASPGSLPLARDLGRSYARLHACGFRFRDGKGDNFLLDGERLAFVDLDGFGPLPRFSPFAAIASDLARLLAWLLHQGGTPFLRGADPGAAARAFYRAYLRARRDLGLPVRDPRSLAKAISLGCASWRRRHPQNP